MQVVANIRHYLKIDIQPEKVYKAVSEQEGLAGWWTTDTVARPEIEFENEFKFGDLYFNKMKVLVLEPGKHVRWQCVEGDREWIGTYIEFDLTPDNGGTILRFAHTGWRDETDFYARCNYNWALYMKSLKDYCETGTGSPFQK